MINLGINQYILSHLYPFLKYNSFSKEELITIEILLLKLEYKRYKIFKIKKM